ncbi:SSU ribosomal protein S12P methylthiotransferase [Herbinix hemicellulosilytica]|uniref:Ribosomal protein uS12 methylthiotransferase RimO n=1 Tax=Herbinix hemicellulosilytica TaxID=1564487 RepID=A0A0H5SGY1_HERHM|nr:30S ribosomal protein S12 methylthiotransferase RimO [Herbinix hemicellulosilytica]RBP60623.1 SSU ribosomal protein S12P methylthiotransferase [Herbinix hemicellulosilytica]CRZ34310.1 Ribosomal protein S12 methylthiotransferase RimO [Herbinix hemicellulosilytica]
MDIFFVSLGCDKNLVDSENMIGILKSHGYTITDSEEQADIIIVNTCCFINDAKEESIQTILEMAQYKKYGKLKALIVTGCLAQRYKDEILKEIPEVDALLGTTAFTEILTVVDEVMKGKKTTYFSDLKELPKSESKRILSAGSYYSYLKIAEGCNKHCTYCIIPKVRGNYRSRPMEELIEEASYLASMGVKELILVAQETTLYGVDLYGKKSLPELLKNLCKIEGIEWIRLLYCYPEEITKELIDTIKSEPKICKYLDIPIQHCSDRILKLMGRRTSKADIINIVNRLREEIPGIVLRTTLITGFPTETDEEHEELMDFINNLKFDRLGVFTYSREEDTPAALLKPQIKASVKKKRQKELMKLQQSVVFEASSKHIGKTFDVIIEGRIVDKDNVYVGRTYMDAPQVDGYIFVNADRELFSGEIVKAKVTGANNYDLIGEIVKGSAGNEFAE